MLLIFFQTLDRIFRKEIMKMNINNCVDSIPGLGSQSTVLQDRFGPTKPSRSLISITLQGSTFSVTQASVDIYRDKPKFERVFYYLIKNKLIRKIEKKSAQLY